MPRTPSFPKGSDFSGTLLAWYQTHQRDLPWRRTKDPYRIWISETMLQQTQVATVIPYWQRWIERFPTVGALADAPLEDVLKAWQGLGYYARARRIHLAAQKIRDCYAGEFPTRFEDVLSLPGVGRYTAGAICSIALGQNTPIVDANVIRTLCRVFHIGGDPQKAATQTHLWEMAEKLIPPGSAGDFNQALMELGALICLTRPRCDVCPVRAHCYAFAHNRQSELPEYAPKQATITQTDVLAVIAHPTDDSRIAAVRRPATGLWGGLWEFPRITTECGESVESAAVRAARTRLGLAVTPIAPLATVRHAVMNRKVTLVAVECRCVVEEFDLSAAVETEAAVWITLEAFGQFPLPSPQARLVNTLRSGRQQPRLF